MKFKHKLVLLFPFLAITSCGYRITDFVEGNIYNSPVFVENIYSKRDKALDSSSKGLNVELETEKDVVITKYSELKKLDAQASIVHNYLPNEYGKNLNMSDIDSSFKYGYLSKLFDGRVTCEGYYQLSRVQTIESGFNGRFRKESGDMDENKYFAMTFRATTDNSIKCYKTDGSLWDPEDPACHDSDLYHSSKISLTIHLYTKNNIGNIIDNTFTYKEIIFDNVTNAGSGTWGNVDNSIYKFFAFSFKNYYQSLSRIVGFGVDFDVTEDPLVKINEEKGIDVNYSLLIYEVFFPYTQWN